MKGNCATDRSPPRPSPRKQAGGGGVLRTGGEPQIAAFLDSAALPSLRRRLLSWYARHARDLPWRRSRDAYAVWVSEIMLQQTTVTAVIPYYERFLARFPSVRALADAEEHEILKLWEGLGYYSRGRNLHRAARVIVSHHGGRFPTDVAALQALPGVGRYTAGAIASFAHDQRAPIVEANTQRLYARLLGYRSDPRNTDGQRVLWAFAEQLLPARGCGQFNQALMEVGATICTPTQPRCAQCPLRGACVAFRDGIQAEIPPAKSRPAVTEVVEAAVAVRRRGRFLLRQRESGERWAGLWDFPRFALQTGHAEFDPLSPAVLARVERGLAEVSGLRAEIDSLVADFMHSVTRYRIRLLCYQAAPTGDSGQLPTSGKWRWARPAEFESVALSTSGRRFARLLQQPDSRRT